MVAIVAATQTAHYITTAHALPSFNVFDHDNL